MTHKLPQGIDAGLRESLQAIRELLSKGSPYAIHRSDGQNLEFHELITIGNIFERAEAALLAAPPDPRKDLAALEQAARKVELSVEEVRQLTLKSWPREHSNPPDVEEWRATIAALIRNNIDLKYALAEMRGAKR